MSSPTADDTNPSLPTAESPTDMEAPLESIVEKPMNTMTEEELRNHLLELRTLRTSQQSFRAALGGVAKPREAKVIDDLV